MLVGENRESDIISYTLPTLFDIDELDIVIAYAPQETGKRDGFSASVAYDIGDVFDLGLDKLSVALATESNIGLAATTRLVSELSVSGFDLGFMYQTSEEDNSDFSGMKQSGIAADTTSAGLIIGDEQEGFVLSAAYNLSDWKFKAQYAYSETQGDEYTDPSDISETLVGRDAEVDITQIALGVDYKLGKKTKAFAYYSMIEGETYLTGNDALENNTLGLGIEHKF